MVLAHVALASWIMLVQQAFASLMATAHMASAFLMALVVWASFWCRAIWKSDTSFFQMGIHGCPGHKQLHPMILFISPCKWNTSSGRVSVSSPVSVLEGGAAEMLAHPGSFQHWGCGGWVADRYMVSSGEATHGDTWGKVATGLEESSILAEGGAPRAADVVLFGVESPNAWLEVSSTAHDKNS